MPVHYRKARPEDLDEITELVCLAVQDMCRNGIFQWDDIYPMKEDFKNDILQGTLEVGLTAADLSAAGRSGSSFYDCERSDGEQPDRKIAVVYAINDEYDEQYQNGGWVYSESTFKVIHRLCIHPDYQHHGIGNRTLEHIEKTLAENHVESIRLDAFSKNPYAVRLYEKRGYRKVGEADFRKGLFYLMEKGLNTDV